MLFDFSDLPCRCIKCSLQTDMGCIFLTQPCPMQCLIKICHSKYQCSVPRNRVNLRLPVTRLFLWKNILEMSGQTLRRKRLWIFLGSMALMWWNHDILARENLVTKLKSNRTLFSYIASVEISNCLSFSATSQYQSLRLAFLWVFHSFPHNCKMGAIAVSICLFFNAGSRKEGRAGT